MRNDTNNGMTISFLANNIYNMLPSFPLIQVYDYGFWWPKYKTNLVRGCRVQWKLMIIDSVTAPMANRTLFYQIAFVPTLTDNSGAGAAWMLGQWSNPNVKRRMISVTESQSIATGDEYFDIAKEWGYNKGQQFEGGNELVNQKNTQTSKKFYISIGIERIPFTQGDSRCYCAIEMKVTYYTTYFERIRFFSLGQTEEDENIGIPIAYDDTDPY